MAYITNVQGPVASSSSTMGNFSTANNTSGSTGQMSYDQIVAENLRRAMDNAVLQQCRDTGETNVPADELLIPVPSQPTGTALQLWISAFAQLSPNSQNKGTAILTPKSVVRPNVSTVLKVLFDSSKEAPSGAGLDSTYNFGIHSFIHNLLLAGQYCPLTSFTNANTEHLHHEGHSLKRCKINVNGVSYHLLDLSQFKNELDIDPLSWQEAYQCYLTWIKDISNSNSLICWTNHFTTLSKDDAVHKNFCAIIEFNIKTRQNYTLCPDQHDQAEWNRWLQNKKYETMQDIMFRMQEQLSHSTLPDHNLSSSSRFEPYNNPSKPKAKKVGDLDVQSFQDNKSSKAADPMCIICRRTGHRFSVCSEEISSKGAQNYVKYSDGSLCRRSNGSQLCITYNLNNPKCPCRREHTEQHLCSFCGCTEHSALLRICI
jgi:hypothetical protein